MSWIILDIIILCMSVFFRSATGLVAGIVMFGAITVNLVVFVLSYNDVEIADVRMAKYGEENEKAVLTVYINNSSVLPFFCSSFIIIGENRLHRLKTRKTNMVFIKPKAIRQKAEVTIKCPRYGRMDISVYGLKINDLMGIVRLRKKKKIKLSFVCTPKIIDVDYPQSSQNNPSFMLSDEYSSIKELSDNENVRNVNWKLTASKNKLLAKEFEKISKDTVLIFLEYNNKDVLINLFSYCKGLIEEEKRCEIMYAVDEKYSTFEIEDFDGLIDFFAMISDKQPYDGEKGRAFTERVYINRE